MKRIHFLSILSLLFSASVAMSQTSTQTKTHSFPALKLSIEPAIGITPYPMSDLVVSTIVQWNVTPRLNLISRSAYTANTIFQRDFNYIHTDYSYALGQTIGIGTSLYGKHASHTFSFLAGITYDATKETLNNPDFETVSMESSALRPDAGLMYNVKVGKGKVFFSYRMYIPLYPYPFKTTDINAIDGNMANLSLEFGLGIRLK
jgi:hypothetical protein